MKNAIIFMLVYSFFCFLSPGLMATEQEQLMVSAAASLRNVMEASGKLFEQQNPKVKVNFNFAASGVLTQQIIAGAPVDIFFSADIKEFDRLQKQKNILLEGFPKEFLRNSLCFALAAQAKSTIASIEELVKPEWQLIAIGNARTVPAGRYAKKALKATGIYDQLQSRYIFCENVRQVLDYVVRGEVDGGFVYMTDAKTAAPDSFKEIVKIAEDKHGPIIYGLGKISYGENPALADRFLEFIKQSECEKIFTDAGFSVTRCKGE